MTEIAFFLRFAFFRRLPAGTNGTRKRSLAWSPRVEGDLPGNDCDHLYNSRAMVVCAPAHKAGGSEEGTTDHSHQIQLLLISSGYVLTHRARLPPDLISEPFRQLSLEQEI